jgi:hypothetical protein
MKSCRCRGDNENCSYCSGKGYLNEADLAPEPLIPFLPARQPSVRRGNSKGSVVSTVETVNYRWCEVCGRWIRSGTYPMHMFAHRERTKSAGKGKRIWCDLCRGWIRSGKYRTHMLRHQEHEAAAAASRARPGSPGARMKGNNGQADEQAGWVELRSRREERRLDATYGRGGTFREHGRFGSPASHDSDDDDSAP